MNRDEVRRTYEKRKTERAATLGALEGRARAVGLARAAVVVAVIALLGAIVWAHLPDVAWLGVLALVASFAALVVVHARIYAAKDRAAAAVAFYEAGLSRLAGTWLTSPKPAGDRFSREDHPYGDDLDVYGAGSLFRLLDATSTRFGEETLSAWLSGERPGAYPDGVKARQAAVKDVASRLDLRENLAVLGSMLGEEKPDPRPFLAWATEAPGGVPVVWVARILPLFTIGAFVLGHAGLLHPRAFFAPLALSYVLTFALAAKVAPIVNRASSRESALSRYADLIALVEAEAFEAPLLADLQARLKTSGLSATAELRRLGAIVGFLDARENGMFRFVIAPVFLWDINCASFLDAWRARAGKVAPAWFEALGELEALASLANFAFENEDYAWPELGEGARFEAEALAHPLLPRDKRVANDVSVPGPGAALVITGSNMAGKSTMLRALGVNAVLALAGAPACARRLSMGPLTVVTSMRVRDSLGDGTSRFYAELKKLRRVLDAARKGDPPAFYLLDEVLHGTNARERLIGARALVKELSRIGAVGAISTHDLALGELEDELAGKVKNVHFEEQVEGEVMTFDYKLRPGVVQSSNALRLMKIVGLDVVE